MNPVKYAEDVLDVHGPWVEAQEILKQQDELRGVIADERQIIFGFEEEIKDQRLTLVSHPLVVAQSSKTARADALKDLELKDPGLKSLQDALAASKKNLHDLESRLSGNERKLFVLTARMNELGGLLQFYAAAKSSSVAADTSIKS